MGKGQSWSFFSHSPRPFVCTCVHSCLPPACSGSASADAPRPFRDLAIVPCPDGTVLLVYTAAPGPGEEPNSGGIAVDRFDVLAAAAAAAGKCFLPVILTGEVGVARLSCET